MRRTMRYGLRRWILTAAMSLSVPTFTYAKPPDLPTDLGINFAGDDQPLAPETPVPVQTFDPGRRNASPAVERLDPIGALFQAAEIDRSQGRTVEARKGYERVHLLAPTSPEGILAMERLQSLEARSNGFSEEQEPPVARTSNRRPIRDLSEAEEPSETPRARVRVPKRTREEIRRTLELLRDTEPLGMVPTGPGSF
ncbi:MAG TPA: hypothetical protein VHR72_00330 [Gemmataceae bacterium]|jgi:hypothetical protein|nr:hypothetical protein [Gemmataceae bacterium]